MNNQAMVTEREVRKTIVERAITNGTVRYIFAREKKIEAFVKRHYTLRGALKIHSHALGWDLIRVPINIIWSVLNIVLALVAFIAKVIRLRRLHEFIQRIPPGLETDMDKEISWLLVTELLDLPHQDGSRRSDKDALMEEVMKDPDLRRLLDEELECLVHLKDNPGFREELDRKLAEYGVTRTGAADLASNVVLLVSSKFALGQASFGALSAGSAVSASVAKTIARLWHDFDDAVRSSRMDVYFKRGSRLSHHALAWRVRHSFLSYYPIRPHSTLTHGVLTPPRLC
jgi:uncharacterized protein DUF6635